MNQSLAQKRAQAALSAIDKIKDEDHGNYRAYVQNLPAQISTSGLGQAMAMLKSRSDKGYKHLYAHMQSWLCNKEKEGWKTSPYNDRDGLIKAIVEGCEADYIRAQMEAMAYLEWLKKFALAILPDKNADQGPEGQKTLDGD